MCIFCDNQVTDEEGPINPIYDADIYMGHRVPRTNLAVAICKTDNAAVLEFWLDDVQVGTQYIKYCPMCGRKLKGAEENV